VGAYAEQDAVATLKLWQALKVELEDQELWHIWDIENGLIPCMLDMRTQGVRVDLDKAERNKKLIRKQSKLLRGKIEKEAGMEVDIWASASIQKMFDKLGMEYPRTEIKENEDTGKTTGGAPSFTKAWLNNHPAEICRQGRRYVYRQHSAARAQRTHPYGTALHPQGRGRYGNGAVLLFEPQPPADPGSGSGY
jgi:hypothetical protein